MSRSRLVLAAMFVVVFAASSHAASVPTGTIACVVTPTHPLELVFSPPYISRDPSPVPIGVKAPMVGTCDNSGVTGGKAPITHVAAALRGRLVAGSTCADVISTPHFDRMKLTLKWRNLGSDGRYRTVATSGAHLIAGSWDDVAEALVFDAVLFKGAFAGSTVKVSLTFDAPDFENPGCPPHGGMVWGDNGEATLTVQ